MLRPGAVSSRCGSPTTPSPCSTPRWRRSCATRPAAAPTPTALVAGDRRPATRRRWTYAELLADAERAAAALAARFEPGERVAVVATEHPRVAHPHLRGRAGRPGARAREPRPAGRRAPPRARPVGRGGRLRRARVPGPRSRCDPRRAPSRAARRCATSWSSTTGTRSARRPAPDRRRRRRRGRGRRPTTSPSSSTRRGRRGRRRVPCSPTGA